MSINSRTILSAIVFGLTAPVFAIGSDEELHGALAQNLGVDVAQTTATTLSDSDIRRINHYAAQALDALGAFGGGAGDVDVLRQKVQRLVDAGQRSGMDLSHTADYFEAYAQANSAGPMPGAFLDVSGNFDAQTLLSSVSLYLENSHPAEVDVAAIDAYDLAAVNAMAQRLSPSQTDTSLQLTIVTQSTPIVVKPLDGPIIAADAPANVRAILERVRVRGSQWVITVEPGDSLGQYSNALYGDTLQFQRIYEANLDKMATPNVIEVGQELVLPRK